MDLPDKLGGVRVYENRLSFDNKLCVSNSEISETDVCDS